MAILKQEKNPQGISQMIIAFSCTVPSSDNERELLLRCRQSDGLDLRF